MSYWTRGTVTLHLSESGLSAFAGTFDAPTIEVSVEWVDDLGLWIFREQVDRVTSTVMLVRWSHFDTAVLDAAFEEPGPRNVLGFRK